VVKYLPFVFMLWVAGCSSGSLIRRIKDVHPGMTYDQVYSEIGPYHWRKHVRGNNPQLVLFYRDFHYECLIEFSDDKVSEYPLCIISLEDRLKSDVNWTWFFSSLKNHSKEKLFEKARSATESEE